MMCMLKGKCGTGLWFDDSSAMIRCDACAVSEFIKSSFAGRESSPKQVLEIIHMQLCGPMRCEPSGRARYYLEFIDDHSRWCQVNFVCSKGGTVEKLIEYKNSVENQTGFKTKAIQSDNGGEFCNKKMALSSKMLKLNIAKLLLLRSNRMA